MKFVILTACYQPLAYYKNLAVGGGGGGGGGKVG